ncbi:MAG: hypothetical protein ACQEXB_24345 [Bacillota bacterium]
MDETGNRNRDVKNGGDLICLRQTTTRGKLARPNRTSSASVRIAGQIYISAANTLTTATRTNGIAVTLVTSMPSESLATW